MTNFCVFCFCQNTVFYRYFWVTKVYTLVLVWFFKLFFILYSSYLGYILFDFVFLYRLNSLFGTFFCRFENFVYFFNMNGGSKNGMCDFYVIWYPLAIGFSWSLWHFWPFLVVFWSFFTWLCMSFLGKWVELIWCFWAPSKKRGYYIIIDNRYNLIIYGLRLILVPMVNNLSP